jgi:hypothetical protein
MSSDQWTDRLSEYLDQELDADEQTAIETHLRDCAACRQTLDDLRTVVQSAGALVPRPPQTDLWAGIAARIGAGDSEARGTRDQRSGRQPARRVFAFTLPQLAMAAVLLIVSSVVLSWAILRRAPEQPAVVSVPGPLRDSSPGSSPEDRAGARLANFADPQYDAAVADLRRALEAGRGRLDPKTIDVLEKNIAAIDSAIDQARNALAADPANAYLNSYLADARRRKLDLLREATSTVANLSS